MLNKKLAIQLCYPTTVVSTFSSTTKMEGCSSTDTKLDSNLKGLGFPITFKTHKHGSPSPKVLSHVTSFPHRTVQHIQNLVLRHFFLRGGGESNYKNTNVKRR